MSKIRKHKSVNIYQLSNQILEELKPQVKRIEATGSIRRQDPNANDMDFVVIPKNKNREFKIKNSIGTNWSGDKKIQYVLNNGLTVDLFFTTPSEWGAALLHFTGPKGYDIGLKMRAKKNGWKLNEYGLFNEKGKVIASRTEMDIYKAFGKHYKAPENR